jgi:hypothetical protein
VSLFVDTSALYALLVGTERDHRVLGLDPDFAAEGFRVVP